jgi:hypothetical protein
VSHAPPPPPPAPAEPVERPPAAPEHPTRGVRRRVLLGGTILVALLVVVGAAIVVPAVVDLAAARRVVSRPPQQLDEAEVADARRRLERAAGRLGSPPGRALSLVPVLGPNVSTLRAVAADTVPVLDAGLRLKRVTDAIADSLVDDGAVDFRVLTRLERPLDAEVQALGELEGTLRDHRSGWLMPPLWNRVDDYHRQVSGLHAAAIDARRAVDIAPAMLGSEGPRTYLVALLNNTELRGAGGILSGIGTITARGGRLETGEFQHYKELADEPPYRTVEAPEDFRRHFGIYDADTTRWLATSSSPDVPDVAVVARRLFELTAGVRADGVIFADPRGIAALMPPGARVEVPKIDKVVTRSEVPRFVYKTAYEVLGGASEIRRSGLIDVGHEAFADALSEGLKSMTTLGRAADAVAGQHLRVVSFHERERRVLEAAGLTGELGVPGHDGALVTVQNYGGNKLDYYARRSVGHACEIDEDGAAVCTTQTTIRNETPLGLTDYQYQYKPLGLFKNYVETYVPRQAEITAVEVDGRSVRFYPKAEDGYRALGVYLPIPRTTATTVSVSYTLPAEGRSYSLELLTQPLAHDARALVRLDAPRGWIVRGPDGAEGSGTMSWSGDLDRRLRFDAAPSHKAGLSALWDGLARFWNEPVF